jgi:hypothetical protein
MGLDINGAKLIVKAKAEGVNFDRVVTIGRQGLHLSAAALEKIFASNDMSNVDACEVLRAKDGYAEPLFHVLGASIADSIDASSYENATIIHNMNEPIPAHLKSKYTAVIDGGSLEHVFNFPTAIKNCLELLEPGGFYIGITPTNNFFGHGFYQFSPELYFRIFNEENGCKIVKMLFYTDQKNASVYEVSDPNVIKNRVLLSNRAPSYLFVIGQRVEEKEIFKNPPLQSDYENLSWKKQPLVGDSSGDRTKSLVKKMLPNKIIRTLVSLSEFVQTVFKPTGTGKASYFKKIKL